MRRLFASVQQLSCSAAGVSNVLTIPDFVKQMQRIGRRVYLRSVYVSDGFSAAFDVSPSQPISMEVFVKGESIAGQVLVTSSGASSPFQDNRVLLTTGALVTVTAYFAPAIAFSPCFVFEIEE